MFSHLFVILFKGGEVYTRSQTPLWADTPLGRQPPPSPDGHCSWRYASYWNAFLFRTFSITWKDRSPCNGKRSVPKIGTVVIGNPCPNPNPAMEISNRTNQCDKKKFAIRKYRTVWSGLNLSLNGPLSNDKLRPQKDRCERKVGIPFSCHFFTNHSIIDRSFTVFETETNEKRSESGCFGTLFQYYGNTGK